MTTNLALLDTGYISKHLHLLFILHLDYYYCYH